MNRRDYRAHVEWRDGIRAGGMTLAHANRHARRPGIARRPLVWRILARLVGGAA